MTDEPKSDIPAETPGDLADHGDHPADPVAHHADTHMDAHTALSDDDHGHAEAALGPIDWRAWGYAIVGGLGGLVVLYFFWIALS